MTTTQARADDPGRLEAAGITWDLSDLLQAEAPAPGAGSPPPSSAIDALLDQADALAARLAARRGQVAGFDAGTLADHMATSARLLDALGRAGAYSSLRFAADMTDPANGALQQRVQERATVIRTQLLWFDLEWAALDDERVATLLADERLAPYRHHLESERRYRPHLLSEPEELVLTEKAVTGRSAWGRLFGELTSALEVDLDGRTTTLEEGLSRLASPDRDVRRASAEAVTAALAPGLATRAFLFNTLLHDKAVDDRLRSHASWISSRNLANEVSDESVQALVDAVRRRYDLPQRWYSLKAQVLGLDRLADYDRMASLAEDDGHVGWAEAKRLVLDGYRSFSPVLADTAGRFFDGNWIDAPARRGKRPGAFCSYTVPSAHPYLFLNYTARRRDVLTLAHELGHGVHAYLARHQGVFHQTTPLTVAETASVFGETMVFGRLLEQAGTPEARLSLLAEHVEGAIATVFRQTAMNRFEHLVHTARREQGELSVETFGDLWAESQEEMLGSAVEITPGYRTWWSYVPHFISTPGYVYAYAYGQLLALSVYRQYELEGEAFVPRYLELLAAGGSMAPEALGRIVGVDLADPAFWEGGLAVIDDTVDQAEHAAREAGRLG